MTFLAAREAAPTEWLATISDQAAASIYLRAPLEPQLKD